MREEKLFRVARQNFRLPYGSDGSTREPLTNEAANLPFLFWPNGRWCYAVNSYILVLYDRGLSRQGIGGTLVTYASNLSHLLRFCFREKLDFLELSDSAFSRFIYELQRSQRSDGGRKMSDRHVRAIATNCLDFLEFLSGRSGDITLLGEMGRIRAYRAVSGRYSQDVRSGWFHPAIPTADASRRRHPISTPDIQLLRGSVNAASATLSQRRRRLVMLRCLEITGGRRIEVARITVASVVAAIRSPGHHLQIQTAKTKGGKPAFREIPCSRTDLADIWDYIRVTRNKVIRSTIGHANDHGFVFVNERTGGSLRPNTVTQEIQMLARAAGITQPVSPHLFRHRFITKVFVALIQQHDLATPQDLRRALISLKDVKAKLMQWTGHTAMESLDHYIDLAFSEVHHVKNLGDSYSAARDLEALRYQISQYAHALFTKGNAAIASALLELI